MLLLLMFSDNVFTDIDDDDDDDSDDDSDDDEEEEEVIVQGLAVTWCVWNEMVV